MITMIQLGSDWAGADGAAGPVGRAAIFQGPKQREDAFSWARARRELGSFDVLTVVSKAERGGAAHVVCTCGKELQNGRGKVSHGKCGACCKEAMDRLNAELGI